jgi:hypothetical protein
MRHNGNLTSQIGSNGEMICRPRRLVRARHVVGYLWGYTAVKNRILWKFLSDRNRGLRNRLLKLNFWGLRLRR